MPRGRGSALAGMRQQLFTKLGARNRAEALRRAREMGLIPGDS